MAAIVPFSKKLLWSHICDMYQGEWVALTDCEWDRGATTPKRAVVCLHALDRKQLSRQVSHLITKDEMVIVYVGASSRIPVEFAGAA